MWPQSTVPTGRMCDDLSLVPAFQMRGNLPHLFTADFSHPPVPSPHPTQKWYSQLKQYVQCVWCVNDILNSNDAGLENRSIHYRVIILTLRFNSIVVSRKIYNKRYIMCTTSYLNFRNIYRLRLDSNTKWSNKVKSRDLCRANSWLFTLSVI